MEFELIIPVARQDFEIAKSNIPYIRKYLHPKKIVIISSAEIANAFEQAFSLSPDIQLMDENQLYKGLSFEAIRNYLASRGAENRTGWYFQQILKMAYAYCCDTSFYLSWDADTVPLRPFSFFGNDRKPIMSTKREYNAAYFDTMKTLLNLEKIINDSFIAEHMMFNRDIMLHMISEIEKRTKITWYIGILDSINAKSIKGAGFSEFETYGTYVMSKYPNVYTIRNTRSIRHGKRILGSCPPEEILNWLGKNYDTISFEKWDKQCLNSSIYFSSLFRKIIPSNVFITICFGVIKLKKLLMNGSKLDE